MGGCPLAWGQLSIKQHFLEIKRKETAELNAHTASQEKLQTCKKNDSEEKTESIRQRCSDISLSALTVTH